MISDCTYNISDNPSLQNDVLQFISSVLVFDHPRLSKPLRTNILVIKVKYTGITRTNNAKYTSSILNHNHDKYSVCSELPLFQ